MKRKGGKNTFELSPSFVMELVAVAKMLSNSNPGNQASSAMASMLESQALADGGSPGSEPEVQVRQGGKPGPQWRFGPIPWLDLNLNLRSGSGLNRVC